MKIMAAALLLPLLFPGAAFAQVDPRTLDKAGKIVTQPVRDIGIDKEEIPQVLQEAVKNPYAPLPASSCYGLNVVLGKLNAVLGDDFTVGAQANEDLTGGIAEMVGRTLVNSLIPFRGLVREISGAAPAERRLQAAVTAGIARRGYLRGQASAQGCKIGPIAPPPIERPTEREQKEGE